jgi:multiple sugar transport system substrate-binding protein
LMMEHHGQPARVEAWQGCQADGLFRGSHKNLCTTMESAWTRPRFAGYIVWQDASGKLVERLLAGDLSEQAFLDALIRSWEKLGPERSPLSDKGNELQGAP